MPEIITTFTCNWVKDFDGQGWDFEDFHGVKRSFTEDEKILFVLGYTSKTNISWQLEIFESLTGNTVYKRNGTGSSGGRVITTEIEGNKFSSGVYIYNFTMGYRDEKYIRKSEKFEIVKVEQED